MTTLSMTTLNYSITEPVLRSPVEEWQPHAKQSESTTEWWYLTAVVHDTAGNAYFLVWCPFHFNGEAQGLMFSDCPRKWLLNNSVCQSWAETASRLDAYKRSSRLFGYISGHRFLAGFVEIECFNGHASYRSTFSDRYRSGTFAGPA